ncbi:MAG: FG-GAP-like repeat-containing protein, partial [Bacteroidota bacterium]
MKFFSFPAFALLMLSLWLTTTRAWAQAGGAQGVIVIFDSGCTDKEFTFPEYTGISNNFEWTLHKGGVFTRNTNSKSRIIWVQWPTPATDAYISLKFEVAGTMYTEETSRFNIYPAPVPNAGTDQSVCHFANPVSLTDATPVGGTWTGEGIVDNTFDPALVSPGRYTLTYTYIMGNCGTYTDTRTITVEPASLACDKEALVDLYNATDGANWTNKTNWISNPDVSTWYGVTVSGDRVTSLDLHSNQLIGATPGSFRNLDALTTLSLYTNQLTSVDISGFPALTTCYVQYNKLTQLTTNTTSPDYYSQLVDFRCCNNLLSSVNISNMPALKIAYIGYEGGGANTNPNLSSVITNPIANYYTQIDYLDLSNARFTSLHLTGMQALKKLYAIGNQLTTIDLTNLPALQKLDIADNQLTNFVLPSNNSLTYLSVYYNQLTSVDISGFPALTTCYVQYNKLTQLTTNTTSPDYYSQLVDFRCCNNLLSSVNISNMPALKIAYIGYEGGGANTNPNLSSVITNPIAHYYTQIDYLDLSNARFTSLNLTGMQALKKLYVGNNQLQFDDIEPYVLLPTYVYSPQATVANNYNSNTRTFSVQVGGSVNQYQWQKNGVNIPNATATTFVITNDDLDNNAAYRCVITSPTKVPGLILFSEVVYPQDFVIPFITSLSPSTGSIGTTVTIQGRGFNPVANQNVVYFGAVKATISAASRTQLKVVVPAGATSVAPITVTNLTNHLGASSLAGTNGSIMFDVRFPHGILTAASYLKQDFSVGQTPIKVAVGDFNSDGRADIVVSNYNSGSVSVLLRKIDNQGFDAPVDWEVGTTPADITTGDLNGDGKTDIVVSHINWTPNATMTSILLSNNQDANFELIDLPTGINPWQIAIADFNGDGRMDFATGNQSSRTISVVLRNPAGFDPALIIGSPQGVDGDIIALVAADFNSDGRIDLATAQLSYHRVQVLLQKTAPFGFENAIDINNAGISPTALEVGDFNGDGKMDIATANPGLNTVSVLQWNASLNKLEWMANYPVGTTPNDLTVGDWDGDGNIDLAVATRNGSRVISLLHNTNNTGFEVIDYLVGYDLVGIATGDFNGDGKADLVTANQDGNSVSVLTYHDNVVIIPPDPGKDVVVGSDQDLNYITTNTILVPGKRVEADLNELIAEELSQSTTYFDGLGRPIQSVATQGSPSKKDMVQPIAYDAFGREPLKYLPYTAEQNGLYKIDALTSQANFYLTATNVAHDANPYAKTAFEASPLNRVLEQGAPGSDWQPANDLGNSSGKTVKARQRTNTAEEVRQWTYDFTTQQVSSSGFYASVADPADATRFTGQLMVSETTDEHGLKSLSYTDKEGHVVAKKIQQVKGLVASYPFSDSELGNQGIVHGATPTTDRFGHANSAFLFDGIDDYLRMPASSLKNSQYTYALWVKPTLMPATSNQMALLSVGNETDGDQFMSLAYAYVGSYTGWMGGGYNQGGSKNFVASQTLPALNEWYHLTLTRDEGSARLYVNGTFIGSVPMNGTNAEFGSGMTYLTLGARGNLIQFFQGAMDDVQLYDRVLSASEVQDLAQVGDQPATDSFVETNYVYDDFGLLRLVIQPEGMAHLPTDFVIDPTSDFVKQSCFTYNYDARHRMIRKCVPGASPVEMVYNIRDELVATRDGNQTLLHQWSFIKYDVLGRVVQTGLYFDATRDREALQSLINDYQYFPEDELTGHEKKLYEMVMPLDATHPQGYSNLSFPVVASTEEPITWLPAVGTHTLSATVLNDTGQPMGYAPSVSFQVVDNRPPVVNAGPDQFIPLTTPNTTLAATASDPDGTIAS